MSLKYIRSFFYQIKPISLSPQNLATLLPWSPLMQQGAASLLGTVMPKKEFVVTCGKREGVRHQAFVFNAEIKLPLVWDC